MCPVVILERSMACPFLSFYIKVSYKTPKVIGKLVLNYVLEELIKIIGSCVAHKSFRATQLPRCFREQVRKDHL